MDYSQEAGFVTINELYNVFVEALRDLDEKVYPREGLPPSRTHMVEFVDGIKLRLMKRAKDNIVSYLMRHPQIVKMAGESAKKAAKQLAEYSAPDSREQWMQRTQLGKKWAQKQE